RPASIWRARGGRRSASRPPRWRSRRPRETRTVGTRAPATPGAGTRAPATPGAGTRAPATPARATAGADRLADAPSAGSAPALLEQAPVVAVANLVVRPRRDGAEARVRQGETHGVLAVLP